MRCRTQSPDDSRGTERLREKQFSGCLEFVSDALNETIEIAIQKRGGIESILRKSSGRGGNESLNVVTIQIEIQINEYLHATYQFELAASPAGAWWMKKEECEIFKDGVKANYFKFEDGKVASNIIHEPQPSEEQLYLFLVSGVPDFNLVYRILREMRFYNFQPEEMRKPKVPTGEKSLNRDGGNAARIFGELHRVSPKIKIRLGQYLETVVPSVKTIYKSELNGYEVLDFKVILEGVGYPTSMSSLNMSDGTLKSTRNFNSSFPVRNF